MHCTVLYSPILRALSTFWLGEWEQKHQWSRGSWVITRPTSPCFIDFSALSLSLSHYMSNLCVARMKENRKNRSYGNACYADLISVPNPIRTCCLICQTLPWEVQVSANVKTFRSKVTPIFPWFFLLIIIFQCQKIHYNLIIFQLA